MAKLDNFKADITALAEHLGSREITLPQKPEKLLYAIKFALLDARDERVLATPKDQIHKMLWISDSPVGGVDNIGIYGGEKDFKRTGAKLRFLRNDGGWFHFTITVGVRDHLPLTLVAYDFELCFSDAHVRDHHFPKFIRFDLNEPGHETEKHGLRSHVHPGHDDLIAPAPRMGPLEILHLFLYGGLVPPSKIRGFRGAMTGSSSVTS